MKNSIYLLAAILLFFACKKESNNSTPNTVPNSTNTITCIDNPNINFTSIGNPKGKFGECIKDIDANIYKTVTIGTQTWMAENLKTSKYNDGTVIPNVTINNQWQKNTTGAWSFYNNDAANNVNYCKLYNWYAVSPTSNGKKNLCPTGWHVPTDVEWTILTDYLGGESIAGGKMKEVNTTNWNTPNTDANNTSLFTGLPGLSRNNDGTFGEITQLGGWWSSTESKSDAAWIRYLDNTCGVVYRNIDGDKEAGISIRCLRD